tara:strand:- start:7 stop:561 length:555 start_codon:yes stop_codon:yes gene_type:complete
MKTLTIVVVLTLVLSVLFFTGTCNGARWKNSIKIEVNAAELFSDDKEPLNTVYKNVWLTEMDKQVLNDYASMLREDRDRSFDSAGGERELFRRARQGAIDMSIVDEILSREPFEPEPFETPLEAEQKGGLFTKDFYDVLQRDTDEYNKIDFIDQEAPVEDDDSIGLNIYILFPHFKYITRHARV